MGNPFPAHRSGMMRCPGLVPTWRWAGPGLNNAVTERIVW